MDSPPPKITNTEGFSPFSMLYRKLIAVTSSPYQTVAPERVHVPDICTTFVLKGYVGPQVLPQNI